MVRRDFQIDWCGNTLINAAGQIKRHLKRTGIPLGIRPDTQYSGDADVALEAGDIVLLVTDGIEEAMGPDESFFGEERTLEVVRSNRNKSSREILEQLYRAVRDFSQNTPQVDDVTAILFKVL